MNSREAMASIEQIRESLARAEVLCSWRTAAAASTGAIALLAALVQWQWGLDQVNDFLCLWIVAAGVGVAIVATEMSLRYMRSESTLVRDAMVLAVRQFVPCLVAGMLLTIALERFSSEVLHLLPGLWAIIFSLGIFASRPCLPRAARYVAGYYLLAGMFIIATTDGNQPFAWWPMPLAFGVGQLSAAAVLYLSDERRRINGIR
jgi:hypothetical protein